MQQEYVLISRDAVVEMIAMLERSTGYCRKARPAPRKPTIADIEAEPTTFYSGASGYAGATMGMVSRTLLQALNDE